MKRSIFTLSTLHSSTCSTRLKLRSTRLSIRLSMRGICLVIHLSTPGTRSTTVGIFTTDQIYTEN